MHLILLKTLINRGIFTRKLNLNKTRCLGSKKVCKIKYEILSEMNTVED